MMIIADVADCDDATLCGNGNCIEQVIGFSCECESDYTGDNCETGKFILSHYAINIQL